MGAHTGEGGGRLRMRSHVRRIEGQHERLEGIAREVLTTLEREGTAAVVADFLLYETALEAHMTVEEDVTFPRLHGLRADLAPELIDLMQEHEALRNQLVSIKGRLKAGDGAAARGELESLAFSLEEHEAAEEDLFERVSEGPIPATTS